MHRTYKLSATQKSWIYTVLGVVITLLFLFPLYWMVTTALKPAGEAFSTPSLWVKNPTFEAFIVESSSGVSLFQYFCNSLIISLGSTLVTILLGVTSAYGLARFHSKFTLIMLLIFLVAQMLPSSLILTPLFINFSKLGLINNFLGVIFADATITIPFTVIILRPFFKDIPKSLEESACIDGCGALGTFVRIMMPISYPGIVVACAMSLFMAWGDMVFSLTFLNQEKLKPLSLIMYKAMGEIGVQWEILMAYATVIVIPIVIIFIFLQKYIVAGLTAGSVKG